MHSRKGIIASNARRGRLWRGPGSQPPARLRRVDGHRQRRGGRSTAAPVRTGNQQGTRPAATRDERPNPRPGRSGPRPHAVRAALGVPRQSPARCCRRTAGRHRRRRPPILAACLFHPPQRRPRADPCAPAAPPGHRERSRSTTPLPGPELQGARPPARRHHRPRRRCDGSSARGHPHRKAVYRPLRGRRRRRLRPGTLGTAHPQRPVRPSPHLCLTTRPRHRSTRRRP